MEPSLIILLVVAGAYFLWRRSKNAEVARVATARLAKDAALYKHIKEGMREYHWRNKDGSLHDIEWESRRATTPVPLFETAHLSAFHVNHPAESRVGFYFKDLNEYGLWSFFAHDEAEFEGYYRTDANFQAEEMLLYDEDDERHGQ